MVIKYVCVCVFYDLIIFFRSSHLHAEGVLFPSKVRVLAKGIQSDLLRSQTRVDDANTQGVNVAGLVNIFKVSRFKLYNLFYFIFIYFLFKVSNRNCYSLIFLSWPLGRSLNVANRFKIISKLK